MPESKPKARSRKASPSKTESQQPPKKRRSSGAAKKPKTAKQQAAAQQETTPSAVPNTPTPTSVLIVDNGGDTLKYGWMNDSNNADNESPQLPHRLPNVTARLKHQLTVLVGDEYQQTAERNPNQMYAITRSTERGVVTNLGNQVQVWKRMLDHLGVAIPNLDSSEISQTFGWKVVNRRKVPKQQQQQTASAAAANETTTPKIPAPLVAVLLLVPPHCPRIVLDQMMYVWMEDFGVSHVGFATSQICATKPHPDFETGCLVDIGWSATHVVPTFRGTAIKTEVKTVVKTEETSNNDMQLDDDVEEEAPTQSVTTHKTITSYACPIRRMHLGGRHLVNIWKYYASYRQWNLMDQEWILRDVFQKLAFVSLDFKSDMTVARGTPQGRRAIDRNFVLPDYQTTFHGHVEMTDFQKYQQQQEEKQKQQKEQEENQQQQQEQEENEKSEDSDDEDFEDEDGDKLQEDDEDDGDYDDDAEGDKSKEEKGKDAEDNTGNGEKTKPKKKSKKKKKRRTKDEEDDNDDGDDDDEDEDEDDDDNKELLRIRLLRQKQDEERRRRELEAEQQVLTVSVERFAVPEVLFYPSDAGLPVEMAGLPHMIVQSIKACPKYLQPALYRSIQVTGGVSQLPNLQERLHRELRSLVPCQFDLVVTVSENPIDQPWLGARDWARSKPYTQWSVSRDEWESGQKRKALLKLTAAQGGILV